MPCHSTRRVQNVHVRDCSLDQQRLAYISPHDCTPDDYPIEVYDEVAIFLECESTIVPAAGVRAGVRSPEGTCFWLYLFIHLRVDSHQIPRVLEKDLHYEVSIDLEKERDTGGRLITSNDCSG